jgi:hypothetical protein
MSNKKLVSISEFKAEDLNKVKKAALEKFMSSENIQEFLFAFKSDKTNGVFEYNYHFANSENLIAMLERFKFMLISDQFGLLED